MKRLAILLLACSFNCLVSAQTQITKIEYYVDSDPGFGSGTDVPVTSASEITDFNFTVTVGGITDGFHTLHVRCQDSNLNWSNTYSRPFFIASPTEVLPLANIDKLEYYIDTDPGFGNGIDIPVTSATEINGHAFSVDLSNDAIVPPGFHTLNIRGRNANGSWTATYSRPFYKASLTGVTPAAIVAKVEYFFDADPGFGAGVDVPITASPTITDHPFIVDISSISTGFHTLNLRTQDDLGNWSTTYTRPFYKAGADLVPPATNIQKMEYFVDADPGFGLGIDIPIAENVVITDHASIIPLDTVSPGFHTLSIRTQNANGNWSFAYARPFYRMDASTLAPAAEITRVEYFIDSDPGFGSGIEIPVSAGTAIENSSIIPLDTVAGGFHTLNIRSLDANGQWSKTYSRPFYRTPEGAVLPAANIVKVEYFFDEDPGAGSGFALDVPHNTELNDHVVPVDLNNTVTGEHTLNIRFLDANGLWSMVQSATITACVHPIPVALEETDVAPGTMTALWEDLAVSDSFLIYVSKDTFKTFIPGYNEKVVYETFEKVINLSGGNYQYRVRAVGDCPSGLSNTIYALLPFIAVTEADSLALVAFYNSTNGGSWTVKNNWLVNDVINWHGITLDNFKVVSISLPSNNLTGNVSPELASLKDLQIIDLSGNKLTSIPDLSTLSTLTSLNVSNNALNFGSLEPNINIGNFNYLNQALISNEETVQVDVGVAHQFQISTPGTNNVYKWYFNGSPIDNSSEPAFEVLSSRAAGGAYRCEVTNTLVPGLTLVSRNKTLVPIADVAGRLYVTTGTAATAGKVTLFRVTVNGGYDTIAQVTVNNDGSYGFQNVPLADYQLLGFADVSKYPTALPTYYENTLYWEEASTIELNGNETGKDIVSQHKPIEVPVGQGIIEGYLIEEIADDAGRVMAKKRVKGAGVSVRRTERSGRGKALELVSYIFTNDNGEFRFEKLPADEYVINIQYPGYPMDNASDVDITVGEDLDSYQAVEAEVAAGKIVVRNLIVTSVEGKDYQVDVYPNPTANFLNLNFGTVENSRVAEVLDITGKSLLKVNAASKLNNVDISSLKEGIYLLDISEKKKRKSLVRIEIINR